MKMLRWSALKLSLSANLMVSARSILGIDFVSTVYDDPGSKIQ